MVNRHNRLLVAFHVISDALLGVTAFIIAYALRFHTPIVTALIPITRGVPPLQQYIQDLPFVATLVPLGFQLQGLYRLRRGRSRVDDFFAVFVGSILAVVFGIVATLYVQTYFASPETKSRGAFEVSQAVWAIFLVLNVALAYASRELVARGDRSPLRRAPARTARADARADRNDEPRVRRRESRARSAAGHRAPGAARGPRRRPGHQHQRRSAAGLQHNREARNRRDH